MWYFTGLQTVFAFSLLGQSTSNGNVLQVLTGSTDRIYTQFTYMIANMGMLKRMQYGQGYVTDRYSSYLLRK